MFKANELDQSKIYVNGFDGTNMSGEKDELQRYMKNETYPQNVSTDPIYVFASFLNLMSSYSILDNLDLLCLQLWKALKFSTINKTVLDEIKKVEGKL